MKTLKDIDGTDFVWYNQNQKEIPEREVCVSDLRQEAIRWFKHFFNITEEDLK